MPVLRRTPRNPFGNVHAYCGTGILATHFAGRVATTGDARSLFIVPARVQERHVENVRHAVPSTNRVSTGIVSECGTTRCSAALPDLKDGLRASGAAKPRPNLQGPATL